MLRRRDFPKVIQVKDALYEVKWFSKGDEPDQEHDTIGYCDGIDHVLYVRTRLKPRVRLETFVHEWLHAVEYEYGLEIPHALVYALEKPLADFLLSYL